MHVIVYIYVLKLKYPALFRPRQLVLLPSLVFTPAPASALDRTRAKIDRTRAKINRTRAKIDRTRAKMATNVIGTATQRLTFQTQIFGLRMDRVLPSIKFASPCRLVVIATLDFLSFATWACFIAM